MRYLHLMNFILCLWLKPVINMQSICIAQLYPVKQCHNFLVIWLRMYNIFYLHFEWLYVSWSYIGNRMIEFGNIMKTMCKQSHDFRTTIWGTIGMHLVKHLVYDVSRPDKNLSFSLCIFPYPIAILNDGITSREKDPP